jgi:antitoxin YefM
MTNAQDGESERETLYVLQNKSLMEQIAVSLQTHQEGTGYAPSPEELDALDRGQGDRKVGAAETTSSRQV